MNEGEALDRAAVAAYNREIGEDNPMRRSDFVRGWRIALEHQAEEITKLRVAYQDVQAEAREQCDRGNRFLDELVRLREERNRLSEALRRAAASLETKRHDETCPAVAPGVKTCNCGLVDMIREARELCGMEEEEPKP